jgi:hypothetical protein
MLFSNEDELQSFAKQIAKIFWNKASPQEIEDFITSEYVPRHLIQDVRKYLKYFELEHYVVVLSYSRLLLRDRYKL